MAIPGTALAFMLAGEPHSLQPGPVPGWRIKVLYQEKTGPFNESTIHLGELDGSFSPHPPHCHDHEELIFPLDDGMVFHYPHNSSGEAEGVALVKNSLVFADSRAPHTFCNTSLVPVRYMHVRWRRAGRLIPGHSGLFLYHCLGSTHNGQKEKGGPSWRQLTVYAGPTRFFHRMVINSLTLDPGGQLPLQRHGHDTLFAFPSGAIQVLGKTLRGPGFALLSSGIPHKLENRGDKEISFYAVDVPGPISGERQ